MRGTLYKVGDRCLTPESHPISYGEVISVIDDGRFYIVFKRYGRRLFKKKYTEQDLLNAIGRNVKRNKARRERAAAK
jgi:hypothetical protein